MDYVFITLMLILLIWDIFCFIKSNDKFCRALYILGAILAAASVVMKIFWLLNQNVGY